MPERNPFEETATAGRRPAYSQPDTRFGGNLERANTRRPEPASVQPFPSDRNRGAYEAPPVIPHVKPQWEKITATVDDKPFTYPQRYTIENLGSSNLEKLMAMNDPEGLRFNFMDMLWNADTGIDPYMTQTEYDDEGIATEQDFLYSNAEPGEPGARLVDGEWKKPILTSAGKFILESDPSDWGDSKYGTIPTTINDINYDMIMDTIGEGAYGDPGGDPGGPGSWPAGDGGYDDLAALYGAGIGPGPKQLGEGELVLGQTPLQDYMVEVHRGNPYTNLAMARNGGIIDLVK